ncbi:hypothetical protein [Riemerella columbipharyngis]|uniref:Prohead serine protease n=1 Tax=Riemerella columbipharyngis TaxID=1071918 RepID=A0A1G7FLW6_9FLAO|nr:hypothetical protein [Riemerella columbipharyngis]SDE76873.1 hypothetical protein SAMN05421544_12413 [Riemerella columbipharyngis]
MPQSSPMWLSLRNLRLRIEEKTLNIEEISLMVNCRFFRAAHSPQLCGKKKREMSQKTYTFIASTDAVNSYGYRILTEGIDTTQFEKNPVILYMHNRFGNPVPTGEEVIGRAVALKKEAGKLLVDIEFDSGSSFAKSIEGKVERGFIKMASIGADILATSSEPEMIMPGQTMETVTAAKLTEISIVDIGGNDDAIRLCRDGIPAKLKLLSNNNKSMNQTILLSVALALGLAADTKEDGILNAIRDLKLSKDQAEKSAKEWKAKYMTVQNAKAESIVNEAVTLGIIPENLKSVQLGLLQSNYEETAPKFEEAIKLAKETKIKQDVGKALNEAINLAKNSGKPSGDSKETFDYMQRYDVAKLRKIKETEPEKYAQLAKDYAAGVRYQSNK